jgi:hypothetical protein
MKGEPAGPWVPRLFFADQEGRDPTSGVMKASNAKP